MENKDSNGVEHSVNFDGCQADHTGLSADGRYVLFTSYSDQLVQAGDTLDTNQALDVFVRDRQTGKTRRVSQDANGGQLYYWTFGAGLSADGRYALLYGPGDNWQLDSGYLAYGYSLFLMELDGHVEPTTTQIKPISLSDAVVGTPHTLVITVEGTLTTPVDGMVVVQASTGETCRSDVLIAQNNANMLGFNCVLDFVSAGQRQLRISYLLSATHESSATTATIDVVADALNRPPVADNQSVSVTINRAVIITVSASDEDGDNLAYSLLSPPAHGSLSGTLPTVTYTPDADYTGSDGFTFTANDGTVDAAPATVMIRVNALGVIFSDSFEE